MPVPLPVPVPSPCRFHIINICHAMRLRSTFRQRASVLAPRRPIIYAIHFTIYCPFDTSTEEPERKETNTRQRERESWCEMRSLCTSVPYLRCPVHIISFAFRPNAHADITCRDARNSTLFYRHAIIYIRYLLYYYIYTNPYTFYA